MFEQQRVGVERMQFLFHAFLEDEVFVRDRLFNCWSGFQVGDVLVSVNGTKFSENTEEKCVTCDKTKDDWKPGSKVSYVVKRAGGEVTLNATLAALPSDVMAQMIGMHMMEHATTDTEVAKK